MEKRGQRFKRGKDTQVTGRHFKNVSNIIIYLYFDNGLVRFHGWKYDID